jgi:hypothetical protein
MAQTEFDIPYQGLRIGRHPFKFSLDGAFFQAFEMEELLEAELTADTVLDRFSSMMHFDVELKGSVRLNCDRCGSACQLSIDEKARFVIQFGRKTERNDDDILVLGRFSFTKRWCSVCLCDGSTRMKRTAIKRSWDGFEARTMMTIRILVGLPCAD